MINRVFIIGNTGRDPEIRRVGAENAKVAQFSIATTERYKDKGGNTQERTDWHSIVCWRNLAELVEKYVHKGDKIAIVGKLRNREWTNDKGEKRYATDVVADEIEFLSSRQSAGAGQATPTPQPQPQPTPQPTPQPQTTPYLQGENLGEVDSDLPFS